MVDDFIQRKHGLAKIEYPHPALEPILRPTYGVILYQEQVMQIAQVLAGYTLGAADMLRRAMGKKKPEEMAKQRNIFVEGAKKNNVEEATAASIFDLMEKFAGYGFNKSHSAAYALVSYQTAWLKQHYPAEFMAAVLSSDMDNTDKTVIFVYECQAMGLLLSPPDINHGEFKFTVDYSDEKSRIVYGLGAIKGAGEAALEGVLQERNNNGLYRDLFDFCERNDLRKVNKRVLEALVKSGAFDCFNQSRATLWNKLDKACQQAEQKSQALALGQGDLFGLHTPEPNTDSSDHHYNQILDWPLLQQLQGEKETLGWYLSGHPVTAHQSELKHLSVTIINQLSPNPDKTIKVAGQLIGLKVLMTKRGDRMAIVTVEDETGRIDGILFSEEFEKHRATLVKDAIILLEGAVDHDDFSGGLRMSIKNVTSLEQVRAVRSKAVVINAKETDLSKLLKDDIKQLLLSFPGDCPIKLSYQNHMGIVHCQFDSRWRVKPCDELLNQLRALIAPMEVIVDY
jgi:DNA polymerase-3 subunit alpha